MREDISIVLFLATLHSRSWMVEYLQSSLIDSNRTFIKKLIWLLNKLWIIHRVSHLAILLLNVRNVLVLPLFQVILFDILRPHFNVRGTASKCTLIKMHLLRLHSWILEVLRRQSLTYFIWNLWQVLVLRGYHFMGLPDHYGLVLSLISLLLICFEVYLIPKWRLLVVKNRFHFLVPCRFSPYALSILFRFIKVTA